MPWLSSENEMQCNWDILPNGFNYRHGYSAFKILSSNPGTEQSYLLCFWLLRGCHYPFEYQDLLQFFMKDLCDWYREFRSSQIGFHTSTWFGVIEPLNYFFIHRLYKRMLSLVALGEPWLTPCNKGICDLKSAWLKTHAWIMEPRLDFSFTCLVH